MKHLAIALALTMATFALPADAKCDKDHHSEDGHKAAKACPMTDKGADKNDHSGCCGCCAEKAGKEEASKDGKACPHHGPAGAAPEAHQH